MDVLRNQIIERKVVELILGEAKFEETPYEYGETDAEAIDQTAGGHEESDIPEAVPEGGEATEGGKPEERPIRE